MGEERRAAPLTIPTVGSPISGAPSAGLEPGDMVGRFVVLELLDAGGAGVIYIANDTDLERRVAIKLLRTKRHEALLREAQALARVSHPNVVTIFEVGRTKGALFIAMELVEGETLRQWAQASRRSRGEVIDVMVQAGAALSAVHAAGLVHGDFKPNNVLVEADGSARVVDFGLATDPTDHVRDAGVGTPGYMAPEVFERPATAAADQFAFCVTLTELLAGARPAQGSRLVTSDLPRRLTRIVERGASADPKRRYPSMDRLLKDLRPPAWRLWVLVSLISVALIVGLVALLSSRSGDGPNCEALEEVFAGAWSDDQIDRIEARFEKHARVSNRLDAYRGQWIDTYRSSCRAARAGGEESIQSHERRSNCLLAQRSEVAQIVSFIAREDGPGQSAISSLLLAMPQPSNCTRAADSADENGVTSQAVASLQKETRKLRLLTMSGMFDEARALAPKVAAARGAAAHSFARTEATIAIASMEVKAGDLSAGFERLQDALAAALSAGHERLAIEVLNVMVDTARLRSKTEFATTLSRQAAALAERVEGHLPLKHDVLLGHSSVLLEAGQASEALVILVDALTIAKSIPDELVRLHALGATHNNIGLGELNLGNYEAARASFDLAKKHWQEAYGEDHPATLKALDNTGVAWRQLGELERAAAAHERALELRSAKLPSDHVDVLASLNNLAVVYVRQQRIDRALKMYERVLRAEEERFGRESPTVASTLNNIGDAHHRAGRLTASAAYFRRARRVLSASRGADHLHTALLSLNLASTLRRLGKSSEAKELLESAKVVFVNQLGGEHEYVTRADLELLLIAQARGHDVEDEALTSIIGRIGETNDLEVIAESHYLAAKVLVARGERSEAVAALDRALAASRSEGNTAKEKELSDWARRVRLSPAE